MANEQTSAISLFYCYAYNELNRKEEALAIYEQALRLDRKDISAYRGKGELLISLKKYSEALMVYEQLSKLDPTYAQGYVQRGEILSRLGCYEEALVAYEEATNFEANRSLAYSKRGDIFSFTRKNTARHSMNITSLFVLTVSMIKHVGSREMPSISWNSMATH